MSGLKNLQTRLNYAGGANQAERMKEDKVRSLNKSLLYSYQSATAVLSDGREFRCLINPNQISMESDDKILSIPFEDICLNKEIGEKGSATKGKEPIGVKCGDVILWKENNTRWIIYTQYLQEIAYFRGQMRQCQSEPITIGNEQFYYYLKGPSEKGIDWQKSKNFIFNDLNYSLEIYISNTKTTKQLFHRHSKIKLPFKNSEGEIELRPYEVQAIDDISTQGIIAVYLKEDFNDGVITDAPISDTTTNEGFAPITGPSNVYPYDTVTYTVDYPYMGTWMLQEEKNGILVNTKKAKIIESNKSSVTIEITTGKKGNIKLIYSIGNSKSIFDIAILSL